MGNFTDEHVVTLGDGEQYVLHFDMVAICAFEESSGIAVTSLGDGAPKMTTIVHLLAAALRKQHPGEAKADVILNGYKKGKGRRSPPLLTLKNFADVTPVLMEALVAAMPQEGDEDPEAPESAEGNG